MTHLLCARHKNVARCKQSVFSSEAFDHICRQGAYEIFGRTGGLTPHGVGPAPHIVICYARGNHYIKDVGIPGAAGHSGVDYQRGMKVFDKCECGHGSVHFSYAAA